MVVTVPKSMSVASVLGVVRESGLVGRAFGGVWRRSGLVAQKLRTYRGLSMSWWACSFWHLRTRRQIVGVMSGLLLQRGVEQVEIIGDMTGEGVEGGRKSGELR